MYAWIWRKLPGSVVLRILQMALLFLAVLAVLMLVVFPWLEPRLWFTHVTVKGQ